MPTSASPSSPSSPSPLFPLRHLTALHAVAKLLITNPFGEAWVDLQKAALGDAHVDCGRAISLCDDGCAPLENIRRIVAWARPLFDDARELLATGATGDAGVQATEEELLLYRGVGLYLLYDRFDLALQKVADTGVLAKGVYADFLALYEAWFRFPGSTLQVPGPGHLFALYYQARRAYYIIYTTIRGVSLPTAHLRVQLWDEIFAGDVLRYARWNYERMERVSTLILGDTGTGKELAAQAIGYGRYLAFDEEKLAFPERPAQNIHKVNIAGLAETLVDSLLFGHKKGAFTGALRDEPGELSLCGPGGILFLDEVGDLAEAVQVKLLRVLQERVYTPVGSTKERQFLGRLVYATQPKFMVQGAMRDDFYYRISANVIRLPSLRARIDDDPGELSILVRVFARVLGGPEFTDDVVKKAMAFIDDKLRDHDWPGNVREVQGCVSNIASHHQYAPRGSDPGDGEAGKDADGGGTTLEEVQRRHVSAMLKRAGGNYREAARLLGIDHKTVRRMLEPQGAQGTQARPEPRPR